MIKAGTNENLKHETLAIEEKRSYERIPVEIDTRYFYGNMFYSGRVSDLSEAGMFINTKRCLPFGATLIVTIRNKKDDIRTIARVRRIQRTNSSFDGFGLELLSPPEGYLNFVNKLKYK